MATIITNILNTLYSLERNAIAPSLIALPMKIISLLPSSCFIILNDKYKANNIPIKGTINAIINIKSLFILNP